MVQDLLFADKSWEDDVRVKPRMTISISEEEYRDRNRILYRTTREEPEEDIYAKKMCSCYIMGGRRTVEDGTLVVLVGDEKSRVRWSSRDFRGFERSFERWEKTATRCARGRAPV